MLKEKRCSPNTILIIYFLMWFVKKKDKRLDEYDKEFLDISNIPTLEVDKEVKGKGMEVEEKGLKILTLNKLLTTLSVLLAQIKAGNNSYKLKNEFGQYCLLYQHNKITIKVHNKLIKSL